MQNFMKTILSAMKSWTKKEIKKEISNAPVVAPDWNESNPDSIDYIKNRTHWEEDNTTILVPKTEVTIGSQLFVERAISIKLVLGQTYKVIWNDKEYECTCYNNGGAVIGNDSCWGGDGGNGEPFLVSNYDNLTVINAEQGTYIISIYTGEKVVHKLDPKYLPDDIGIQANWEEEDETSKSYIQNKPFGTIKNFLVNDTFIFNDGYSHFENRVYININANYLCIINGVAYSTEAYYDDTDGPTIRFLNNVGDYVGSMDNYTIYLFDNIFDPSQSYDIVVYTENIQKIDSNFLPDETDPTVPDWAKQDNKPSYTVDEIDGAAKQNDVTSLQDNLSNFQKQLMNYMTFIDSSNGCEYTVYMKDGNLVSKCKCTGIQVVTMPTNTEYINGEPFNNSGMVVIAIRQDGSNDVITNYYYYDIVTLNNADAFQIRYVEDGVTYITTIALTVNDVGSSLADFTYTIENDGTYTLTGWKGTLNEKTSTECIIPDSNKINL